MKKYIPPKHMRDFKHPLVTRRDFLSHGILAFGAMSTLPNFFNIPKAFAAGGMCSGGGDAGPTAFPFMAFDMAGGASLPGNFLVGGKGGPMDLIPSYGTLGWDPREGSSLNNDFGLPMSAKYSTMLAGILATASAPARANLRMGSLCHVADFDTSTNPFNAGILALKSGARGKFINNGSGIKDSNSGGNSSAVDQGPVYKPVLVGNVNDFLKATSFGGPSFSGFPVEKLRAMANGAIDLSDLQKQDYAGLPGGQALADASACSYQKTLEFLDGVSGLDPRQDAAMQQIYNISQNSGDGDMSVVEAGVLMNTIDGNCGPSTWTLGGCDYHVGNSTTGDAKDQEMGMTIGRAVEIAYQRQKPLFFQIITDGGNASAQGSRNWQSDSGERTMTVLGYFDPKGAPEMIRQQVGNFTSGEGADKTSILGSDPRLVAYAAFANYLNVQGRIGDFSTYAPGVFAGAGELDRVLIFAGKKG
jgi:hypothetical protein